MQNIPYDGRFTFARLSYTTNSPEGYYYRGLPAWAHGYDLAERNLMQILNSLSTVRPRLETGVVYSLDDPMLFKYPLTYMTEAGYWGLTDKEALAFRKYLLKGGFVIFDDFRERLPRRRRLWQLRCEHEADPARRADRRPHAQGPDLPFVL